jgi:hypothetical protein
LERQLTSYGDPTLAISGDLVEAVLDFLSLEGTQRELP